MSGDGLAPPASRCPFRRMAFVLGVTAFGAGLPTPLYSIYQQEYGFSSLTLGAIFATYTVGVLVTMFFLAPQADLVGTRPVLYVGMLLTALSGAVFLLADGVLWLFVARLVSGLAVGATTSTATVAMTHREPRGDDHHVARVSVGANFGSVALGVLAGMVVSSLDPAHFATGFWLLIGAAGVGMVAIYQTPTTTHHTGLHGHVARRIQVPHNIRGPFWVAVGGLTACYAIYGFFASLAPTAVREALHLPPSEAAAIVVAMFGSAALVQLLLARVRDRDGLLLGLPTLMAGLVAFLLALPWGSLPLILVGGVLMGLGVGAIYMGSVTLIDRVTPEGSRGEVLAGFYLAGYLALAVPTLGLSFTADRLGLVDAGTVFGVGLVSYAAIVYLATRRTPLPEGGEGRAGPAGPGPKTLSTP